MVKKKFMFATQLSFTVLLLITSTFLGCVMTKLAVNTVRAETVQSHPEEENKNIREAFTEEMIAKLAPKVNEETGQDHTEEEAHNNRFQVMETK